MFTFKTSLCTSGKLSYSDNADYVITDNITGLGVNISNKICNIYTEKSLANQSPIAKIKINQVSYVGALKLGLNNFNTYSWFVGETDISTELFELVDKSVLVEIHW